MSLSAWFESLEKTGLVTGLRESLYWFPILESVHVMALSVVFGMILIVDLRLLGLASSRRSFARMSSELLRITWGAFAVAALTGTLMFMTNARVYADNAPFRIKMVLLALAGLNMAAFHLTAGRKTALWDDLPAAPGLGKVTATLSLILWIGVIFAGRVIGFTTTGAQAREAPPAPAVNFDDFLSGGGAAQAGSGVSRQAASSVAGSRRADGSDAPTADASDTADRSHAHAADVGDAADRSHAHAADAGDTADRSHAHAADAGDAADRSHAAVGDATAAGGATANLSIRTIMAAMVDPSGDFLFESVADVADEHGVTHKAPRTPEEWAAVRHHLQVLVDAPALLETPGRRAAEPGDRSSNPAVENEPEEVQRLIDSQHADFVRRAERLRDAATVGLKAVDARDPKALFVAITAIDKACESCHLHYWYPNDQRAHQAAHEEGGIIE